MALDATNKYWTWRQFNAKVDELCPLESKRLFGQMCGTGATPLWNYSDGSSVYYRNQVRQAVLDLQNFIPEFAKNHETIYYPQDFAADGMASAGALPPMAKVTGAWFYDVAKLRRVPVVQVPWERRFDLAARRPRRLNPNDFNGAAICQTAASLELIAIFNELHRDGDHRAAHMAISPGHETFYLHPRIEAEWVFSLFWDGHKLEYRDQEQVPFEEEAAQAVALFVRAAFLAYVERNLADAAALQTAYAGKRTNLFIRTKSKGFVP